MIVGQLRHSDSEEKMYAPAIREALAYLRKTDLAALEPGRHEIDGDRMFCMISECETSPLSQRKAESHRAYIDVHCVLSGAEKIGFARWSEEQEVVEDLLASGDALLYDELRDEAELWMRPGSYAVFLPNDLHRPGGRLGEEPKVRKAVVKIKWEH
ncbi:YhcH/YjgK/YiaL family protein [Paenibacillus sp. UNCCL117]|uniref:YhcH/YjgK/YiaL family protein n=1 Tax=unclassified Paenibacillus TaxID=185978 RepID=UPI00088D7A16|nr:MULTISPECIES: YhcH/YjgK/YiaL family protein [unclassified Paenibacillus]SDD24245.1 YhcH/YjgK/YiaL family protein [Paenibacillus sp. cl123]SFW41524.1 YhcH/YjgK/YiaL family protein [Paenibacillus sp. UNCCL117]